MILRVVIAGMVLTRLLPLLHQAQMLLLELHLLLVPNLIPQVLHLRIAGGYIGSISLLQDYLLGLSLLALAALVGVEGEVELEFLQDLLVPMLDLDHSVVIVHLVGAEVGVAFLVEVGDDVLDGAAADVFGRAQLLGAGVV